MAVQQENETGEKTFRAHVWSPLNNGEAILELSVGTTVNQLLEALSDVWGANFKPDRGFLQGYHGSIIAGWCVLCRSTGEVFCPLGIDDEIPSAPFDYERHRHARGWFHQTMARVWHGASEPKSPFATSADVERAFDSPYRESDEGAKLPTGVMHLGPHAIPEHNDFELLASGPEPKEPVDVRLALIIAVSGT